MQGKLTLHDSRFFNRKPEAIGTDLYVRFGRETNAVEQLEKLPGRTRDSFEDGRAMIHFVNCRHGENVKRCRWREEVISLV